MRSRKKILITLTSKNAFPENEHVVNVDLGADHKRQMREKYWTLAPKINEYHSRDGTNKLGVRWLFVGEGEAKLLAPAGEGKVIERGVMEDSFFSVILITLQNALHQHLVDKEKKSPVDCWLVRAF